VRVFGNNYVKDVPRADMLAHIAAALRELGDYAQPKSVTVLIESHGDFTDSPSLLELLRQATRRPCSSCGTRITHSFRERSSRKTPCGSWGATSGTRT